MLLFLKARRTARRLSRAHCGVFQLTFSRERLTQASGRDVVWTGNRDELRVLSGEANRSELRPRIILKVGERERERPPSPGRRDAVWKPPRHSHPGPAFYLRVTKGTRGVARLCSLVLLGSETWHGACTPRLPPLPWPSLPPVPVVLDCFPHSPLSPLLIPSLVPTLCWPQAQISVLRPLLPSLTPKVAPPDLANKETTATKKLPVKFEFQRNNWQYNFVEQECPEYCVVPNIYLVNKETLHETCLC